RDYRAIVLAGVRAPCAGTLLLLIDRPEAPSASGREAIGDQLPAGQAHDVHILNAIAPRRQGRIALLATGLAPEGKSGRLKRRLARGAGRRDPQPDGLELAAAVHEYKWKLAQRFRLAMAARQALSSALSRRPRGAFKMQPIAALAHERRIE